jgi:DNA polymerase-3 subunit epsilon
MQHPRPRITDHCKVLDTLSLAREIHPGQRNSLDALCKRYEVDASNRELHGALIDADLLAQVYLAMTGGQTALSLDEEAGHATGRGSGFSRDRSAVEAERRDLNLVVIRATEDELAAHDALVEKIQKSV